MFKKVIAVMVLGLSYANAATYGDSGCGLGSMIFHDQKGFVQIFSATTNGSSGNQTFGISSGTSNCGGSSSSVGFIQNNREAVATEMARGEGATLATLSKVYGCKDEAAFKAGMQKNFSNVFPSENTSAEQAAQGIQSVISTDADLAKACS